MHISTRLSATSARGTICWRTPESSTTNLEHSPAHTMWRRAHNARRGGCPATPGAEMDDLDLAIRRALLRFVLQHSADLRVRQCARAGEGAVRPTLPVRATHGAGEGTRARGTPGPGRWTLRGPPRRAARCDRSPRRPRRSASHSRWRAGVTLQVDVPPVAVGVLAGPHRSLVEPTQSLL